MLASRHSVSVADLSQISDKVNLLFGGPEEVKENMEKCHIGWRAQDTGIQSMNNQDKIEKRLDRIESKVDENSNDIKELKGDNRSMKEDIAFIIKQMDQNQREIRRLFGVKDEQVASDLKGLGDGVRANRDRLDDHESRIRDLEAS